MKKAGRVEYLDGHRPPQASKFHQGRLISLLGGANFGTLETQQVIRLHLALPCPVTRVPLHSYPSQVETPTRDARRQEACLGYLYEKSMA